jgi:hypothetical protein
VEHAGDFFGFFDPGFAELFVDSTSRLPAGKASSKGLKY